MRLVEIHGGSRRGRTARCRHSPALPASLGPPGERHSPALPLLPTARPGSPPLPPPLPAFKARRGGGRTATALPHASLSGSGFKAGPASPLSSTGRGGRRGRLAAGAPPGLSPHLLFPAISHRPAAASGYSSEKPRTGGVGRCPGERGSPSIRPQRRASPEAASPSDRSYPRDPEGPVGPEPVPPHPAHSLVVVLCHVWRRQRAAELAQRVGRARRGERREQRCRRTDGFCRLLSPARAAPHPQVDGRRSAPPIGCPGPRGGAAAPLLGGRRRGAGPGRGWRRWRLRGGSAAAAAAPGPAR